MEYLIEQDEAYTCNTAPHIWKLYSKLYILVKLQTVVIINYSNSNGENLSLSEIPTWPSPFEAPNPNHTLDKQAPLCAWLSCWWSSSSVCNKADEASRAKISHGGYFAEILRWILGNSRRFSAALESCKARFHNDSARCACKHSPICGVCPCWCS